MQIDNPRIAGLTNPCFRVLPVERAYLIRHGWELHRCRSRIPRAVETDQSEASRREVVEMFRLGVSSVIRWCQRWRETGSAEPERSVGRVSPLEVLSPGNGCSAGKTLGPPDPGA